MRLDLDLSQERVFKTLMDLGLSQLDAQVYVFLAKRGLQKGQDIAQGLKIHKQQIYRSLKNLQNKGIVEVTVDHPARYSAEPFQKVIDLFIRAKMEDAQSLRQNRDSILSDWQSIAVGEYEDTSQKFAVIKGRNIIYSKIEQMKQQTRKHLSVMTSIPNLVRVDQFGIIENVLGLPVRMGIELRFLTEISEKNLNAAKSLIKKSSKQRSTFKIRVSDLGLKLPNRMIIKDDDEAMFFINSNMDEFTSEQDDLCLWTNCKSIAYAFKGVFEELWRNSTDLEKTIEAIETGKPASKTSFIQDLETDQEKYFDIMKSAQSEIIMLTSPENLFLFWETKALIRIWCDRGVSVKIMVPITSKNFEVARQLSQFIEVRHVAESYLETTIVDGRHLFQLMRSYKYSEKPEKKPLFRETFYTNDPEQVKKLSNSMDDIWKNACSISFVEVGSIKNPYGSIPPPYSFNPWKTMEGVTVFEEQSETLKEEEILNKFNKSNEPSLRETLMYATGASVIVNPPDTFNLPVLMFHINHIDKRSCLGGGDSLLIYIWLKTADGYAFVPAGGIGDNSKGVAIRREMFFVDNSTKQHYKLVKPDKLQIRAYGNSLFCGWTVPIELYQKYVLPPACLMVDGYGKVKTRAFSMILPSGFKSRIEQNYFDAFVTFIHPASKYSGPGTDGAFIRDLVTTTISPNNS